MVNRRNFLKLGLASGLLVKCLSKNIITGPDQKTNIILILSDDHSCKTISALNKNSLIRTPGIDRIANEGIRFINAFVTNSLCEPSRASLLTGKYSAKHGVWKNWTRFNSDQFTFPKLLQQTGYQTAIIGKWHLQTRPEGFNHFETLSGEGEQGYYYNPDFFESKSNSKVRHEGYVTNIITDKAIDYLNNCDSNKPFFLMIGHKACHGSCMPDFQDLGMFDNLEIPLPNSFYDCNCDSQSQIKNAINKISNLRLGYDLKAIPYESPETRRLLPEQKLMWNDYYKKRILEFRILSDSERCLPEIKYKWFMQDYLSCVASLDVNVSRLLDYLDSHNLADNTIIIYMSDQGFFLGEHGLFDKQFMYEESIRFPLFIRYPKKIAPGSLNGNIVLNIDIAPTLLQLAGIEIPNEIQGESFVRLFDCNYSPNWRNKMFYHFSDCRWAPKHYGIRTDRFKLIHFYDLGVWELYDLNNDPYELRNIYNKPGNDDLVLLLKYKLDLLKIKYEGN